MTNTIRLAGEQAEVFDNQMDVDKALMASTPSCVAFRPAIDGEFSEYQVIGERVPCIAPFQTEARPDWVCVCDVGRIQRKGGPASGLRVRFQCPQPQNDAQRDLIRDVAVSYVRHQLRALGMKAPKPKGFA
jgi:hypothetical protein